MNVLITGACGFLAHALVPALIRQGHNVTGVDRNLRERAVNGLEAFYQGDITQPELLRRVDGRFNAVFHLAADVDLGTGAQCITDNVYAVYVLCEWLRTQRDCRLVFPSSTAVFGVSRDGFVDEAGAVRPTSLYGMSKYLAECCIRCSDVPFRILRFPYIYGECDWKSTLAEIIDNVVTGRPVTVRDESRDFLYVGDAVTALIKALEYEGNETVFNFGSGRLMEMKVAAAMVAKAADRNVVPTVSGVRYNTLANYGLATKELRWTPTAEFELVVSRLVASRQAGCR